jgi:hypothetical protein
MKIGLSIKGMIQNMVLRREFVSERDEVTGA